MLKDERGLQYAELDEPEGAREQARYWIPEDPRNAPFRFTPRGARHLK